jgi:hydroxymethylpyrimidine pyrophosphatase-like HAD family hydrolase
VSADLLGAPARRWRELGTGGIRVVLVDVDGVITPGEGQAADLAVLQQLTQLNERAITDACVPAVTLCTGRPAPYVEVMAQMTGAFLPCIFEHGCGLFFPTTFRYIFHPLLGEAYSARLAQLRAALTDSLLRPGRAFVQPGKEASMTLYPLGVTSLDELLDAAHDAIRDMPGFSVARNIAGVELRPTGLDKGKGLRWMAQLLELPLSAFSGVGDSDPDISFLELVGFSAAPANATPAVRAGVSYVSPARYGDGLLDILTRIEGRNRSTRGNR